MKIYNKYFLYLLALVLVGCKKKKKVAVSTRVEKTENIGDEVFVQKSVEDTENTSCSNNQKESEFESPERVFFRYDSYELSESDISKLNQLSELLKKKVESSKDFVINIYGNCDKRGAASYNVGLSRRRAEAIKNIFIRNGISSSRIKTIGLGQRILVEGDNENAYQQNRVGIFGLDIDDSFLVNKKSIKNESSPKQIVTTQIENEDEDEDEEN